MDCERCVESGWTGGGDNGWGGVSLGSADLLQSDGPAHQMSVDLDHINLLTFGIEN